MYYLHIKYLLVIATHMYYYIVIHRLLFMQICYTHSIYVTHTLYSLFVCVNYLLYYLGTCPEVVQDNVAHHEILNLGFHLLRQCVPAIFAADWRLVQSWPPLEVSLLHSRSALPRQRIW